MRCLFTHRPEPSQGMLLVSSSHGGKVVRYYAFDREYYHDSAEWCITEAIRPNAQNPIANHRQRQNTVLF